jgi:hypothetical protein
MLAMPFRSVVGASLESGHSSVRTRSDLTIMLCTLEWPYEIFE